MVLDNNAGGYIISDKKASIYIELLLLLNDYHRDASYMKKRDKWEPTDRKYIHQIINRIWTVPTRISE